MATFDQLGDAAGSISNRLRRTASIVPERTPAKVKKTQARFGFQSTQPSEYTVLANADRARPEVPYSEGRARPLPGEPDNKAIFANSYIGPQRSISRQEQTVNDLIVDGVNSNNPITQARALARRGAGQRSSQMSGSAAQAMADSRPYGRRMLNADQPDLQLGSGAQKAFSQNTGEGFIEGDVNQTLRDVYAGYADPAPGVIYDLPDDLVGLDEAELARRVQISAHQNVVDTLPIEIDHNGRPAKTFVDEKGVESFRPYESDQPIYKDISSGTIQDRALATGNPMDEYLASVTSPGLSYDERTIAYGQMVEDFNRRNAGQSTRLVLPENAYVPHWGKTRNVPLEDGTGTYELPNVIIPRSAERTVIDNLGPSDLSRRLRQSAQMQPIYNSPTERVAVTRGRGTGALAFDNGQVIVVPETNIGGSLVQQPLSYSRGLEELRNAPVANPVQVDFRQASDQGRRLADSTGRVRTAQLDQQIMAENAALTGADTTNFVIKDVNPEEYYLYGSQKDTQGLLPDEVAGASLTYGYQPSESLVNVGFSSKQVKPVNLGAGRVGLGVDITAQDPYSRAAVVRKQPDFEGGSIVRDPRYVPVDPITPIDLELPGVRYAEKSGLQADVTPEMAIAQDRQTAARLRAIADIEQAPARKLTGGNIPYQGVDDQGKPLTYVSPEGRVIEGWSQQSPNQPISEISLQRLMQDPSVTRRMEISANNQAMADIYESSAANMENAMRIANEQTAPQGNVILTQISNQGPGQSIPIRGQEMPFEEALEIMKPYERGGAAEQVLRLPVVPTVAPEQTQLSKRLRLAQQVGHPDSYSIMSEQAQANSRGVVPQGGLFEQIAKVDPDAKLDEIRRGVQYTMVPKGETGQAYDIRLDNPGVPVINPDTGRRMIWQKQPIETFNPLDQANPSGPEFAVRARATRPQIKQETYQQTADAINEGYVLRGTGDPYDRVLVSGDDLSEMRGGLSRQEMRQAQQHNLAREMSGLAPLDPVEMTNILKKHNLNMQDRTVNLIKNPPAQGGVFMWGDDDFGYGSSMAARFPSSGPPIEVQSGGMLDAFMTPPLEPRMMHPRIRQVDPSGIQAQGPLVYRPAPQVPSQVQPARIEGRADLDWQRSPSFRFPQNVWQGSGR
jgi:hypothetical protein